MTERDTKYYYIRLKDNFFESDEIKVIEAQPNGYKYSNILLKLYLKSLKRNGKLMVNDFIPYNIDTLSAILGHDIDTVRSAIELFKGFALIDILDNGAIYMLNIQELIGKSSTEADRKRNYRLRIEEEKKSKALIDTNLNLEKDKCLDKCHGEKKEPSKQAILKIEKDKCLDKSPPELELEIELEIELELQLEIEKFLAVSSSQSKVILKAVLDKYGPGNVMSIIKEKWSLISSGNFKSPIGALVIAIREDWKQAQIANRGNKLKFNNFTPRDYDYEKLERQLLGWDRDDDEES